VILLAGYGQKFQSLSGGLSTVKKNNRPHESSNNSQPEFWQPIQPRANGSKNTGKRNGQNARGKKYNQSAPQINGSGKKGRKKIRTKKQKIRLALIIAGSVLLVILLAAWLLWRSIMGQMNIINPDKETVPEEYDLPTESLVHPIPTDKNVTNILLLGIDARDPESISERSDAMMILTVDENNKVIKLTSLQRDMLVYLPGKEQPQKINSANVAGGPALAMRVVNETLRLDIKSYVVVNMSGMKEIIDIAGGVTIDVEKAEIPYIPGISEAGVQKLKGDQAVAYARIRKVGSDYARMQRQRTVIQALLDTFLQAGLTTKADMIKEGLPFITTNLKESKIMDLGLKVLPIMNSDIEQLQIPIDGFFREYSGASWVNLCDFNGMIPILHEFIWGKSFPFDPVREIPGAPNGSLEGELPEYIIKRPETQAPSQNETTTAATTTAPAATTTTQPATTTTTVATTTTTAAATTAPAVTTTGTTQSVTTTTEAATTTTTTQQVTTTTSASAAATTTAAPQADGEQLAA
jgi:LCP family protein required for cell wall assembly